MLNVIRNFTIKELRMYTKGTSGMVLPFEWMRTRYGKGCQLSESIFGTRPDSDMETVACVSKNEMRLSKMSGVKIKVNSALACMRDKSCTAK